MPDVAIIGAGLAGSLLAIYLARRGMMVDVYEARGDMRKEQVAAGRSINLALSDRGIAALREVGMDEYMLAEAVPMYGRMVHSPSGETKLLPYSGRKGEYINSISRGGLNIALMNEAEKYENVRFHFEERCVDFDCDSGTAKFSTARTIQSGAVIATDGAGSAIRHAMLHGGVDRFDFSQTWLDHGYKELHIPPAMSNKLQFVDGGLQTSQKKLDPAAFRTDDVDFNPTGNKLKFVGHFQLEPNALHIWPRHKFMMIALPNFDGSFTCTLFLAHDCLPVSGGNASVNERGGRAAEVDSSSGRPLATLPDGRVSARGNVAFDQLTDQASVVDFFNREFPDAVPLMPTLVEDFFHNPTGNLGTVKCFPWNVGGKALLLGDSAHAIVPFYGQGMNCAFEDVRVLDSLIGELGADWKAVFTEYGRSRKPNTDAIADMAEENFYEMRDATADPVFQRKRELETKLEQTCPDYFSKYSMVTFREDLPYAAAKAKGNAQDRFLMELCESVESIDEIDIDEVREKLRNIA